MGFYGNVKDIEKNSSFVFDKIYPNRQTMDYAAKTDNVYIGRYVLVEYDETVSNLDYKKAYLNDDIKAIGGLYCILYDSTDYKNEIKFEQEEIISDSDTNAILDITYNSLVYTQKEGKNIYYLCVGYVVVTKIQEETDDKEAKYSAVIYLSDGSAQEISDANRLVTEMGLKDEIKYAVFQPITSTTDGIVSYSNYSLNYNIDVAYAKSNGFELTGHGWDSTVWQKTTVNGAPKYVMVAELNTVVPTFGLTIDAPTLTPLTPHFDSASTDVYYELHWQPQWGLRVKLADATDSSKQEKVPSDTTTTWIRQIYDNTSKTTKNYYLTENNGWRKFNSLDDIEANGDGKLPAAIYYNKAGFSASNRYHSNLKDNFTIEPTGYSLSINDDGKWENTLYNNHLKGRKESAVDTQEISMVLPSIGNAISDMWDIVYGTGTGNTANQENTSSPRLTSISWEQAPIIGDGNRLQLIKTDDNKTYSYSKTDVETLAGSINSVHDLMGMIIQDPEIEDANLDTFAENKAESDSIYYIKEKDNEKTGKFYRRAGEDKYKQLNDFKTGAEKYQLVDANFTYTPNTYYKVKDGEYVLATESTAETGATYYTFVEAESDGYIYELVNLNTNTYKDGTYYIKGTDGKFTEATGDFDKEAKYYKKLVNSKMTKITFADTNAVMTDEKNGPYYTKTANEDYNKATVYSKGSTYYKVTPTDEGAKTFETKVTYQPNTYYYKNGVDYLLDINSEPSADDEYAIAKDAENGNKEIKQAWNANRIYKIGKYYSKNVTTDPETKQNINYYKLDLGKFNKNTIYYNKNEITKEKYSLDMIKGYLKNQNSTKSSDNNNLIVYQIRTEVPVYLDEEGKLKLYSAYTYTSSDDSITLLSLVWADEKVWSDGKNYYHGSDKDHGQLITDDEKNKYYFEPKNKYTYSGITESYYLFAGQGDSIDYDSDGKAYFYGKNPSNATEMTVNRLYILTQPEEEIIDGVLPTADSKESQSGDTEYYKLVDGNYIRCIGTDGLPDATSGSTPTVYTIEFKKVNEQPFYRSGIYYYQENNNSGNYIKDKTGNVFSATRTYYNITATVTTIDFGELYIYEPGVYYYEKNNRYYIDNNLTYTAGRDYYTGANDYYVFEDEGKVLAAGAKWNIALPVRHGLSIGVRDGVKYSMQELVGFARTLNTIHGLILLINNFLEYNNENTRNTSTVQGVVNTLNDIIAKFEILDYGQFVVTDSYGRMHTAPAAEDKWIETYIDPDVNNPVVHVHHLYNPAKSSIVLNINFNTVGNQNFSVVKSIKDDTGHIIQEDTTNYTLPNSFSMVQTNKKNDNTSINAYGIDASSRLITADKILDTLNINTGNKWIRTSLTPDSDIIEISHYVLTIDKEPVSSKTSLNDLVDGKINDDLIIKDISLDEAGHITASKDHTYTLPYGFKTISTNGRNNNTEDENATTDPKKDSIIANNTLDTLAINSGNKWIRFDTDDESNTLTVSHDIHEIEETAITATDLNTSTFDDIFTIQDIKFDAAGHVTHNQAHPYKLPFGFKTISTNGKGDNKTINSNTTLTTTEIVADNTLDTLAINSGDLWIRINTDATKDTLVISHDIHTIDIENQDSTDLNTTKADTITILDIAQDNAGHLTANKNHTYTLPYGFKTIKSDSDSYTAENTQDTIAITTNDKWLTTSVNVDSGIVIAHNNAQDEKSSKGDNTNSTEPDFGGSFVVPKVGKDEKGHITTLNEFTITLPSLSYITDTKNTSGNVITGIALAAEEGKFTETKSALGSLTLNADVTAATTDGSLEKTDTLVEVLGKLLKKISDVSAAVSTEATTRSNKDTSLDGVINDIKNDYLTSATAASTYLTKSDASSTYVLKSDYDALVKRVATLEETVKNLTSSSTT